MKLLTAFVSAFIFIFVFTTSSYAVTTVTTITTVTKTTAKKAHHKKHCCACKKKYKKRYKKTYVHPVSVYYEPGYCVTDKCRCNGYACYPGYYYQCRTEFSYREGGNSARVEVCGRL